MGVARWFHTPGNLGPLGQGVERAPTLIAGGSPSPRRSEGADFTEGAVQRGCPGHTMLRRQNMKNRLAWYQFRKSSHLTC